MQTGLGGGGYNWLFPKAVYSTVTDTKKFRLSTSVKRTDSSWSARGRKVNRGCIFSLRDSVRESGLLQDGNYVIAT